MRRIALWLTAGAGVTLAGCATVAPVAVTHAGAAPKPGAFTYRAGMAAQDFAYPPAEVVATVKDALGDLSIRTNRQGRQPGGVVIEGATADNRRAVVTVRAAPLRGTQLTTRIGLWGDEALSRALMERVGVRLGSLPPAPVPEKPPSTPGANPYFSRSAVPDEIMFHDLAESRHRDTMVP